LKSRKIPFKKNRSKSPTINHSFMEENLDKIALKSKKIKRSKTPLFKKELDSDSEVYTP